jgi:hypothetical protein
MSNHKFIQVEPPKEELPLPIPANFFEFGFFVENKSKSILVLSVTSPTSTFSTVTPGDFIEFSSTDPVTLIETVIGTMEVATFNTDGTRTMVESIPLDSTLESTTKFIDNTGRFRRPNILPKVYKLPTNNFSLQVKTDSIVRYYEDPVDKTIMYLDVVDSASICGHGTGACTEVWGHDRASLGIVTLNNTNRTPMHNIVPYLNSIFLGADDEN